jgi:hypothetical protein
VDYIGPLLKEWLDLFSIVSARFPQTRERYYFEQTLTGLLVAAGWRINVPGISEARVRKGLAANSRNGRADILLELNGILTAFEAKICWFDDNGGFEGVLGKLEDACSEAAWSDRDVDIRRLGICFGVFQRGGTPMLKEVTLDGVLQNIAPRPLEFYRDELASNRERFERLLAELLDLLEVDLDRKEYRPESESNPGWNMLL